MNETLRPRVGCDGLVPEIYGPTHHRYLGASSRLGSTMNTVPISPEDEAAIRQLVQVMRDGQESKDGELFATAFAQDHDYFAIRGKEDK